MSRPRGAAKFQLHGLIEVSAIGQAGQVIDESLQFCRTIGPMHPQAEDHDGEQNPHDDDGMRSRLGTPLAQDFAIVLGDEDEQGIVGYTAVRSHPADTIVWRQVIKGVWSHLRQGVALGISFTDARTAEFRRGRTSYQ